MKKILMLGGSAVVACSLQAQTVALWPMEYDAVASKPNMRCAVSGANGFTYIDAQSACAETTLGWNLPPNPETNENLLFSPVSRHIFDNKGRIFRVDSPEIAELVNLTHDFTIEGWIRPRNVKDSKWRIIMQSNGGTGNPNSWSWTIRNTVNGQPSNVNFQTYVTGYQGDYTMGAPLTAEQESDLTSFWHHIALVYRVDNGAGKNQFTFYYDGVEWGKSTAFGPVPRPTLSATYQEFGGRPAAGVSTAHVSNGLEAEWDYWRLSDEALEPTSFLNYGGTGTIVPEPTPVESKTLAYWKLGTRADGTVDANDYIGGAQLSQGFMVTPAAAGGPTATEQLNSIVSLAGTADSAFVGQPPNTTVVIPGGNVGAVSARTRQIASVRVPDVGANLELDRSFTVEGYFRYRESEELKNSGSDFYLFGTTDADRNTCWCLRSAISGETRRLEVSIHDFGATGTVGKWKIVSFGDVSLPRESRWVHIALAFDRTGGSGNGLWTLYFDGKFVGSAESPALVGTTQSSYFFLFGRGDGQSAFFGDIDCVRVAKAVLAPQQLLCESENPQAATDVLGFWPLDCPDGVHIDGRDLGGDHTLCSVSYDDAIYRLAAVADDAPVVSNPDPTVAFHGDKERTQGSVAFRSGDNGKKSYLLHRSSTIAGKLLKGQDWTLEFYTKRAAEPGNAFGEIVMLGVPVVDGANPACNSSTLVINYGTQGFKIHDSSCADFKDPNCQPKVACAETAGAIPVGEWAHAAIVRTHDSEATSTVVYRFYVNGSLKGSLSAADENVSISAQAVLFGGSYDYWAQKSSWNGQWSSLRFSTAALDPEAFLCATRQIPAPTYRSDTLGYWPLEYKDGAFDLGCRAKWNYAPFMLDLASLAGEAGGFPYVLNPDPTLPVPVRRNQGSVHVMPGTAFRFPDLGSDLGFRRAFTVEGWVKLEDRGPKDEVLFGACGDTADCGWKVLVDYSGATPALKLWAKSAGNWSLVAGGTLVADISSWFYVWKHLALAYDPSAGERGMWTLFVDGQAAATVPNAWFPGTGDWAQNNFRLGGTETATETGVGATFDHWRVVGRALTATELLQVGIPGLMLMVK